MRAWRNLSYFEDLKNVRNFDGVVSSKVRKTRPFTSSRLWRRSSAVEACALFLPE